MSKHRLLIGVCQMNPRCALSAVVQLMWPLWSILWQQLDKPQSATIKRRNAILVVLAEKGRARAKLMNAFLLAKVVEL